MILSQNDYLDLFNIFDNLNNIVDNDFLNVKMIVNNEKLYLNTEEIILANYYNYHDDTSNVVYTSLIPDLLQSHSMALAQKLDFHHHQDNQIIFEFALLDFL